MVALQEHTNKKIVLDLPRIYKRGPPSRIILTSDIIQKTNLSSQNNSAHDILYELYLNKNFSQSKIGELFDVQRQTVRRWLDRLKIPVKERADVVSEVLTKYKRTPFSNDLTEKAYLLGLRYGDISAQKHGRHIRAYVATSHPAMLQLFNDSFKKYSKIRFYPKFRKIRKLYDWCIYVDLDNSFSFLLNKNINIPTWILDNNKFFFAFLSGYFDSEGCISIYYSKKWRYRNIQWIIKSNDKLILESIIKKFQSLGFDLRYPKLDKKAGTKQDKHNKNVGYLYKKDYWSIQTSKKSQIFDILNKMNLKHKEKIAKYRLSIELMQTNWKNATEKIILLRNKIKKDVESCIRDARICYSKNHKNR